MPHHFGVYFSPGHQRPSDLDYMRHLQPPVVRILEPDPNDLRKVWAVAPAATLLLRYWWLDDGNRQQHAAMVADPLATATRHAREWREQLIRLDVLGNDKVIVTGVNEPDVNNAQVRNSTIAYTRILLLELANFGIRGGALNLPVGHPAPLKDGAPDWTDYLPLEAVIRQTNGVLVLHEYWQQEGPNKPEDVGWLALRHIKCPLQVPIVIGEAGVDGAIYNRYPNNVGYRGVNPPVAPNVYAEQLVWYHNHCDPRVVGICPFSTDYRDNHWASFDTEPAHGDILARLGQLTSAPATPPLAKPPVEPVSPPAGSSTLTHPLPGSQVTQHMYQNPDDYARFGLPGHNGTDLSGVPERTPVKSIAHGIVSFVGEDADYGFYCRVWHPKEQVYSFYGHLAEGAAVQVGAILHAGTTIGFMGNTGNSTGAHLHFEIRLASADGSYNALSPMPKGRCDPETWCAMHGLKLGG